MSKDTIKEGIKGYHFDIRQLAKSSKRRGNMSDETAQENKSKAPKKGDPDNQSKEWLKDYLKGVYGVKMSGQHTIQRELLESGQHMASNLIVDDFLFRLLARFNDLDIAPCDGYISMAELEYAIRTPRLYFDADDVQMLTLLKRYFQTIKQVCMLENDIESNHDGLSRYDLELLSTSDSKNCASLRNRLKAEFVTTLQERAK
jgi:hypothetical protein